MNKLDYISKLVVVDGEEYLAHYVWPSSDGGLWWASWKTVEDYVAEKPRVRAVEIKPVPAVAGDDLLWSVVERADLPLYGGTVESAWSSWWTLDRAKNAAWERIKAERSSREYSGFAWDGSRFDSDAESQRRIQGAAQLAMIAASAGQPFSIDWTLEDNTVRTLSGAEMIQVGLALGAYVGSLYDISRSLRDAIAQATTVEELNTIVWPS